MKQRMTWAWMLLAIGTGSCSVVDDLNGEPDAAVKQDASVDGGPLDEARVEDAEIDAGDRGDGAIVDGVDAAADAIHPDGTWKDLVLWLDAEKAIDEQDSRVVRWNDQSGLGNHAWADIVHAPAALEGGPSFDSNQHLVVSDHESLHVGVEDFILAVAVRHTTPTDTAWGYGAIFSKQESVPPYLGPSLWGNALGGAPTGLWAQVAYREHYIYSAQTGLNDGRKLVALMIRRDGRLELRLNNESGGNIDVPEDLDLSAVGNDIHIGGVPGQPLQALTGQVMEVLLVRGSAEQASSIEEYLVAKHL